MATVAYARPSAALPEVDRAAAPRLRSFREIAGVFGISADRVRQIHDRALAKLRALARRSRPWRRLVEDFFGELPDTRRRSP